MRRSNRVKAAAVAGIATVLASLVVGLAAASADPTGDYAPFKECPYASLPVDDCFYGLIDGGSLTIGTKTIPVVNPITLQGGYTGSFTGLVFHGAKNGDTLSKTPQPVPGGLLGVTPPPSWPQALKEALEEAIEEGLTGVTATVELAASATSIVLDYEALLEQTGTALGLPVKIKLANPFLGSNCYIGSNAEPIELELTTGKSGALDGSAGTLSFDDDFTIVTLHGIELVDSSFEVPGANGCGGVYSSYVDPLVESIFGVPAASGNAADLEADFEDSSAAEVDAHDP